jgi:hypothetical protein
LIQPITHWDVKVADLPVVKDKTVGGVVEGVFIMKDALLQVVEAVLVTLLGNSQVGLAVRNGLEESICNGLEKSGVKVRLGLEGGLDGTR